MSISKKVISDESIRILLERRETLQIEISKLMAEYRALGDLITRTYTKKPQKQQYDNSWDSIEK